MTIRSIRQMMSFLFLPVLEWFGDLLFTYGNVRGIRVLNARPSDPDHVEQAFKTMSLALDLIDNYDSNVTNKIQENVRRIVIIDKDQYMAPKRGSFMSDLRDAARDPWIMASDLVWYAEYFQAMSELHSERGAKKRASQARLLFLKESGAPEALVNRFS